MERKKIIFCLIIFIVSFTLGLLISNFKIITTGRVVDNIGQIKMPSDYLKDNDFLVYDDKIILKIENAKISDYESSSMEPFLGKGVNGIVIIPKNENELEIGDIITYKKDEKLIVHRIIDKGKDENGMFFITRGDNSNTIDGKIRFERIEHKLVGILY